MLWALAWYATLATAAVNLTAFPANGTVSGNSTSTSQNNTAHATFYPDYDLQNFQYEGIALGGWLVLEPYITPSLFLQFNSTNGSAEIPVDEYNFCKSLGNDEAQKQLENHWQNWITEQDIVDIKGFGFNMIRIPVGYWSFIKAKGDPYVSGADKYLDLALGWARDNDLKVWIDLHGVPGSQNGFDSSGYRDIGYPGWFNSTENVELTHKVLNTIFTRYGSGDMAKKYKNTLLGIEIVNEPLGGVLSMDEIKKFMKEAYENAEKYMEFETTIVFHDAFQPTSFFNDFLNSSKNILIDHHKYEVFSEEQQPMNITQHMDNIKGLAEGINQEISSHPAVVGEWSAALTDCTPWLNGVGLGARYDGGAPYNYNRTGSCDSINDFASWPRQKRKDTRKFIEMQLDQYSRLTSGWIFWCYKTESTIEWDFRRLVENGLFPQPFNNFTYIVNGKDTDSGAKQLVVSWGVLAIAAAVGLMM